MIIQLSPALAQAEQRWLALDASFMPFAWNTWPHSLKTAALHNHYPFKKIPISIPLTQGDPSNYYWNSIYEEKQQIRTNEKL